MARGHNLIRTAPEVAASLASGGPVVALESTVLAHGLPYPLNLETAQACVAEVRRHGVTPATIGIVEGSPVIGLSNEELESFAKIKAPDGSQIRKVSLNNLASVMLNRDWGATTVAATMQIASKGGLQVFATGGIGGVHRGVSSSHDVSADLTALSRIPLICVCAGAKAILDLPKTVEHIETLGVPVVGYRTDQFPAFYSTDSGLPVDCTVDSPEEAAALALNHWRAGMNTAVLICVPVPEEIAMSREEVEQSVERAVQRATELGIRGKALTPFMLAELERTTEGRTLRANRALLVNNASVAAQVARYLTTEL
jgi:pseudouridine-5'-phosphate glycosidase